MSNNNYYYINFKIILFFLEINYNAALSVHVTNIYFYKKALNKPEQKVTKEINNKTLKRNEQQKVFC